VSVIKYTSYSVTGNTLIAVGESMQRSTVFFWQRFMTINMLGKPVLNVGVDSELVRTLVDLRIVTHMRAEVLSDSQH